MNAQQTNRKVEIRLATRDDAPCIGAVLYAAFAEYESLYTREAFAATTPTSEQVEERMSEGPVWVAEHNDKIIGTVGAAPRRKALYVRGMAVLPEARGHHIGESLLVYVERFALERGYERLTLSTTPFLIPAIRLYERHGFRRGSAGPHDLFGTPLFTMVKELEVHKPSVRQ